MENSIYHKLIDYKKKGNYPWHMPGHKRKFHNEIGNPYDIDITEIDGFDDLHDPDGVIEESMNYAREVYQTKKTYYLVNGSTVGLLAGISASCKKGDKILIQRNCHKAVYNAVRMLELDPIYIYPQFNYKKNIYGGIDLKKLKHIIDENKDIKVIVLTSPSYEGIVINISGVKMLIKDRNITLIVDEAHGSHFCYSDSFPNSAIYEGADIVIQSLHKTLPSLTQTALLHVCSDKVDSNKIQEFLSIYQSSSPSYVFMASIDYCIRYCESHKSMFHDSIELLKEYRLKYSKLKHLKLIDKDDLDEYFGFDYDMGRLVFSCKGTDLNGRQLYERLENDYSIILEMYEKDYVVAISSIMDQKEDYEYLYKALEMIDKTMIFQKDQTEVPKHLEKESIVMIPAKALEQPGLLLPLDASVGGISKSYVYIYPPGAPQLVPGERIEEEVVEQLLFYLKNNYKIKGLIDGQVKVVSDKISLSK